jgi:hypothetical protein
MLQNVASGLNNALYDAVSAPARQRLQPVPLDPQTFWHTPLHVKAAVFESLRLSACIFGPVRKIVTKGFKLASDNSQVLPKNSYLAASAYVGADPRSPSSWTHAYHSWSTTMTPTMTTPLRTSLSVSPPATHSWAPPSTSLSAFPVRCLWQYSLRTLTPPPRPHLSRPLLRC